MSLGHSDAHIDAAPTRRVRTIVRSILDGTNGVEGTQRNWIHGVPVLRWQQPHAALVGRAHPNDRLRTQAFLQEAARCVYRIFERIPESAPECCFARLSRWRIAASPAARRRASSRRTPSAASPHTSAP